MNKERLDISRELRAVLGFWLKKTELDSVAPLGFESGSLSFSMVSGVPGLSFLPVTPMIVLPGPVRRKADEKMSQHP